MSAIALPWNDRTGRLAPLKVVVFVALFAPAAWIAVQAVEGTLGSRPLMEAIHQAGLWCIRLIALSLAVTPLRAATRWAKLVSVRRMIGVAAAAYAALHLSLYVADQHFDLPHVASEIVLRIYLLIGFIAFLGLVVLAATSTDAMIRRLGSTNWNRLHHVVYVVALLAIVHFFMQSKLDVTEPTIMAGLFALLLGQRLLPRDVGVPTWAAYGLAVAVLTALGEAVYYMLATGAPLDVVLEADFDFSYAVRPVWYVLAAALILVAARLARPLFGPAGPARRRDAPAPAR